MRRDYEPREQQAQDFPPPDDFNISRWNLSKEFIRTIVGAVLLLAITRGSYILGKEAVNSVLDLFSQLPH